MVSKNIASFIITTLNCSQLIFEIGHAHSYMLLDNNDFFVGGQSAISLGNWAEVCCGKSVEFHVKEMRWRAQVRFDNSHYVQFIWKETWRDVRKM